MTEQQMPRYFDANATTPVDPRVLAEMIPYFTEHFGNAESAQHAYGWKAKTAVDQARTRVAALINSHPAELIFTSGSTESTSLAILGYLENHAEPRHLITTAADHKATLASIERARKHGHKVTILPVNRYGQITAEQVANALEENTALVSIMHANNEVGSLNPVAEIGAITRARGVALHVDAAQTAGKELVDVQAMKIDLLSVSAHKFYGPKGIGALFVRRRAADGRDPIHIAPLMLGGGQERGLRGGTHNVPGIVGLGKACEIALQDMATETPRLRALRDELISLLVSKDLGIELNGHPTDRLCNNVHLTIKGLSTDAVLMGLKDIAFSTASACSAGAASYVLQAMNCLPEDATYTNARFGLSRLTSREDVQYLADRIRTLVQNARGVTKSYDTSADGVPLNKKIR